jgi:FtsP/CotA-like multicopper oxidase with cupredoxin domain
MNRNQRLGLVVAVVVIAVVAFVIAKPGGDNTTSTQAGGTSTTTTGGGTTKKETTAKGPPVTRIAIQGTEVQGGVKTITVKKGDALRIVVTSDKPNTLHLHGFDIEKQAAPGKPARFDVKANIEGEFELESHTFEDAGMEAGVAKLRVEPA